MYETWCQPQRLVSSIRTTSKPLTVPHEEFLCLDHSIKRGWQRLGQHVHTMALKQATTISYHCRCLLNTICLHNNTLLVSTIRSWGPAAWALQQDAGVRDGVRALSHEGPHSNHNLPGSSLLPSAGEFLHAEQHSAHAHDKVLLSELFHHHVGVRGSLRAVSHNGGYPGDNLLVGDVLEGRVQPVLA